MKRQRYLIIVGSVSLVLGALVAFHFMVLAPKDQMDRFLSEMSHIDMGSTTYEVWQQRLKGAHIRDASASCNAGNCASTRHTENLLLYKLHLAPLSGIHATVEFKDGIASQAEVLFETDDREAAGVMQPGTGVTIAWSVGLKTCPQHYCTYIKNRWGYDWGVAEMDSQVSDEQRTNALAINTNCLIKIGGCRGIGKILPRVFGSYTSTTVDTGNREKHVRM